MGRTISIVPRLRKPATRRTSEPSSEEMASFHLELRRGCFGSVPPALAARYVCFRQYLHVGATFITAWLAALQLKFQAK